jgi:hypothetical protein
MENQLAGLEYLGFDESRASVIDGWNCVARWQDHYRHESVLMDRMTPSKPGSLLCQLRAVRFRLIASPVDVNGSSGDLVEAWRGIYRSETRMENAGLFPIHWIETVHLALGCRPLTFHDDKVSSSLWCHDGLHSEEVRSYGQRS